MERKLKPIVPDTRTVDIEDDYAVAFWAKAFNVNHSKLRSAVLIVGSLAADVKRQLKKQ